MRCLLFALLLWAPGEVFATPPPGARPIPPSASSRRSTLASAGAVKPGQTKEFGPITMRALPMPVRSTNSHGYMEYRYELFNKTPDAHDVRLEMTGIQRRGFHLRRIVRRVQVAGKSSITVSIMHPTLPFVSRHLRVYVDGNSYGQMYLSNDYRIFNQGQLNHLRVMVSRQVSRQVVRRIRSAFKEFKKYHSSSPYLYRYSRHRHYRWRFRKGRWRRYWGSRLLPPSLNKMLAMPRQAFTYRRFELQRSELSPADWSRQWLGYSRFDGVVVSGEEMKRAPAAVATALTRYVEAGGTLVVTTPWEVAASWQSLSKKGPAWRSYAPGFGRCLVFHKTDDAKETYRDSLTWLPALRSFERSFLPWRRMLQPNDANNAFSVVKDLKIPTRGIFFLMLLFALLIGPGNLWLLARKNRRIWMLWTVPLCSLIACLAMFGYGIFTEGWGGHARVATVTYLDQQSQRATTLGWAGFYMPLTPSDGLRFGLDTELQPQLLSSYHMKGRGLEVDWSRAQHLSSGWLLSRIPFHLRFRTNEQRKERLVLQRKGRSYSMVNGLGAKIKRIWLVDAHGVAFTASGVSAGGQVTLQRKSTFGKRKEIRLRKAYVGNWRRHVEKMLARPWSYLTPGRYLVELDGAPFAAVGIREISNLQSKAVVIGVLGGNHGS